MTIKVDYTKESDNIPLRHKGIYDVIDYVQDGVVFGHTVYDLPRNFRFELKK